MKLQVVKLSLLLKKKCRKEYVLSGTKTCSSGQVESNFIRLSNHTYNFRRRFRRLKTTELQSQNCIAHVSIAFPGDWQNEVKN